MIFHVCVCIRGYQNDISVTMPVYIICSMCVISECTSSAYIYLFMIGWLLYPRSKPEWIMFPKNCSSLGRTWRSHQVPPWTYQR